MKFRKKPVVIEAVQWNGDQLPSDIPSWLVQAQSIYGPLRYNDGTKTFTIKTLEGDMTVSVGDWIIQGVSGELYPCKPDIFDKTYEAI